MEELKELEEELDSAIKDAQEVARSVSRTVVALLGYGMSDFKRCK